MRQTSNPPSRVVQTELHAQLTIAPTTFLQGSTMTFERREPVDRRTGSDRRQDELGPPSKFERRRTVEARQPELTELHLTDDELKALGFAAAKPPEASAKPPV
jgi:hypothetical protein